MWPILVTNQSRIFAAAHQSSWKTAYNKELEFIQKNPTNLPYQFSPDFWL